MEDIIKVNVGGRIFVTTRCTLCHYPDSLLEQRFRPGSNLDTPGEIDGIAFIDSDSEMFVHVLNFLRGNSEYISQMCKADLLKLKGEADYYGLCSLVDETKLYLKEKWDW